MKAWRVLQLADSAFPTGGFAHSAGLEAMIQFGFPRTAGAFDEYLGFFLWNTGHASLPFVVAAHDAPENVWPVAVRLDALLSAHVPNRASRTQGRAFVATCARVFAVPAIHDWAGAARLEGAPAHHAPLFGAVLRALGVDRTETLQSYLHLAVRGTVSAAVRLAIVGPIEGQRLQERHTETMDAVLAACAGLEVDAARSLVPVFDLLGATHDRLYTRLFQS